MATPTTETETGFRSPGPSDSRGRLKRLFAIALLAAGLGPGLWWRDARLALPTGPRELHIVRIAAGTPGAWPAGLAVAGASHLVSRSPHFGGCSALLANGDGALTAISGQAV